MALAQRHRDSIYSKLSPIVGEEETEALLLQFPVREQDEPATREFVHAEIADLRVEMSAQFSDFRKEMGGVIARQTNLMVALFIGVTTVLGAIVAIVSAVT